MATVAGFLSVRGFGSPVMSSDSASAWKLVVVLACEQLFKIFASPSTANGALLLVVAIFLVCSWRWDNPTVFSVRNPPTTNDLANTNDPDENPSKTHEKRTKTNENPQKTSRKEKKLPPIWNEPSELQRLKTNECNEIHDEFFVFDEPVIRGNSSNRVKILKEIQIFNCMTRDKACLELSDTPLTPPDSPTRQSKSIFDQITQEEFFDRCEPHIPKISNSLLMNRFELPERSSDEETISNSSSNSLDNIANQVKTLARDDYDCDKIGPKDKSCTPDEDSAPSDRFGGENQPKSEDQISLSSNFLDLEETVVQNPEFDELDFSQRMRLEAILTAGEILDQIATIDLDEQILHESLNPENISGRVKSANTEEGDSQENTEKHAGQVVEGDKHERSLQEQTIEDVAQSVTVGRTVNEYRPKPRKRTKRANVEEDSGSKENAEKGKHRGKSVEDKQLPVEDDAEKDSTGREETVNGHLPKPNKRSSTATNIKRVGEQANKKRTLREQSVVPTQKPQKQAKIAYHNDPGKPSKPSPENNCNQIQIPDKPSRPSILVKPRKTPRLNGHAPRRRVTIVPPENELQKVGERVMSEHELRVQRSLQKLNVPDWYKSSAVPPQGFLLKRHSEGGAGNTTGGGWQGLTSKTTSLSSLGSMYHATPRSPTSNLLSPSPTPSGHTFSRWSTSRLNSNPTSASTSPCGSARSSFNYRQPYLGWRSQERLTNPRTPAERLAAGLLSQQKQQPSVPNMNELSEVHSSIKEVTSAIVHYVSGSRADDRLSPAMGRHYDNSSSRSASPRGSNSRLCWLESSFVGNKPIEVPETPVSLTATPTHGKTDLYLDLTPSHRPMSDLTSTHHARNNVAAVNETI